MGVLRFRIACVAMEVAVPIRMAGPKTNKIHIVRSLVNFCCLTTDKRRTRNLVVNLIEVDRKVDGMGGERVMETCL